MLRMWVRIESRLSRERGASLIEYSLLIALIAVVAVTAVTAFGGAVSEEFSDISVTLP